MLETMKELRLIDFLFAAWSMRFKQIRRNADDDRLTSVVVRLRLSIARLARAGNEARQPELP